MTVAFLLFALTVSYVLVGWPLLLGLLARLRPRSVQLGTALPSVSVIVAVHNGERFIARKLASIAALDYPRDLLQVIVISDGSDDATVSIARDAGGVEVLDVARGGKCRALNAGIPAAHGELLFLTDVRQELAPDALRVLVAPFADPHVGAVSGELRIRAGDTRGSGDVGLYWRIETWIRDSLSTIDSMFGATGPIYCIRRTLTVPIPEQVLLDDMYLPLTAFFRGYRLVMARGAVAWDEPTSAGTEFVRKVRTLGGNLQLLRYYPGLLSPWHNRMWFHFMSYKVGRLVLPWLLMGSAVSAFWLARPWRDVVLAGIAGVLTAAVLDPVLPPSSPARRVTSPLRTFLTMMVATVLAIRVLFVDPRSLWVVTGVQATQIRR